MTTGQMLNKKLCIKCYNEHRTLKWEKLPSKERLWSKGFVACVWALDVDAVMRRKQKSSYVKVTKEPPSECYYYLEHLMTMQKGIHDG